MGVKGSYAHKYAEVEEDALPDFVVVRPATRPALPDTLIAGPECRRQALEQLKQAAGPSVRISEEAVYRLKMFLWVDQHQCAFLPDNFEGVFRYQKAWRANHETREARNERTTQ